MPLYHIIEKKSKMIKPLQHRKYYIENLTFKIYNYMARVYLQHILPRIDDTFRHTFRSLAASSQFIIPIANNNYMNHSFRATAIRMWNRYPSSMKTAKSLDLFKNLNYLYTFNNQDK